MGRTWRVGRIVEMGIVVALLVGLARPARAASPRTLAFEGNLTDQNGQPLTGSQAVVFRLFDVLTGGASLWQETQTVVLDRRGLFSTLLGSVTPFPATLAFDQPYWIELQVGTEVLAPRQPLAAAPYALNAERVGGSPPHAFLRTDAGTMVVRRQDGSQDQIVLGAGDPNVGLELRSGTTGGTPYLDFSNDAATDFDLRLRLTGDDSLAIEGGKVGIGTPAPGATFHVEHVDGIGVNGKGGFFRGLSLYEPLVFIHNTQTQGSAYVHDPRRASRGGPTNPPFCPQGLWGCWHTALRAETQAANGVALLGVQDTDGQSIAGYQESAAVFGWSNGGGNLTPGTGGNPAGWSAGVYGRNVHPSSSQAAGIIGEVFSPHGLSAWFRGGQGVRIESGGLRVDSGNIGIGTSTPRAKLHVEAGDGQHFMFTQAGLTAWDGGAYSDNTFRINQSGVVARFVINPSGNVGIGTTSPEDWARLDVHGGATHVFTPGVGGVLVGYEGNTVQGRTATDGNGDLRLNRWGGNVGIGTASPATRLDVAGDIRMSGPRTKLFYRGDTDDHVGSLALYSPDGGRTAIMTPHGGAGEPLPVSSISLGGFGSFDANTVHLAVSGDVHVPNGAIFVRNRQLGDLAEPMRGAASVLPGMLVTVDPIRGGQHVVPTASAYEPSVLGVVSSDPAITIGGVEGQDAKPVALSGIVKVKATAANGPIRRGGRLVASATPGIAMRLALEEAESAQDFSSLRRLLVENQRREAAVFGIALEELLSGDDEVLVFLK